MTGASTRDFSPVVVALRASGLGDLLTAVPALKALRRAFPGYRRIVATPPALHPVVTRLGGFVPVPATGLDAPIALARRPDVAVNLHGSGPESHRRLLALGPRRLLAFAHPGVRDDGPDWSDDEWEPARWCRLLDESGIPADPLDLDLDVPRDRDPDGARATLVHPGAGAGARRWPAERFAAVARAEHRAGRTVLVTGSRAERPLAHRVAALAGLPAASVVAGRTDVGGLIELVGRAGCVICGDTGIAHVATACGTPSVVVFGPTPPARWGPPEGDVRHRVLWAGEVGDPHAPRPGRGLLRVTVADALGALAALPRGDT